MKVNGGIPPLFLRAIRFQDSDTEALRGITDPEWEEILETWATARLMPSSGLSDRDTLPCWGNQRIDQYHADITAKFEKIKRAYETAAKEFERAGVEHVVIKGFALYPGYTKQVGLRPQGDIDLYCPPESVHRGQEVLSTLGYVPVEHGGERLRDHLPVMMPKVSWTPTANFFDPTIPIAFELHHRFWNEDVMRFRIPGLDEFWNRRIKRNIDGLEFPAPHP